MEKDNNEKICYIVGAGDFYHHNISPTDEDFVIAVDGGYQYLHDNGVRIDLLIGDFDSMSVIPDHPNIVKLKVEKDDTDMMAAIRIAINHGYNRVNIYGGTGGRFDHTLANIQCLAYLAHQNSTGFLYGENYILTAITNGSIKFNQEEKGYISIYSHTDKSFGVNLQGLKYELKDATLTNDFPIGVSNEFIGNNSFVSVKEGTLIIYFSNKK